jgi:hypothetical protein
MERKDVGLGEVFQMRRLKPEKEISLLRPLRNLLFLCGKKNDLTQSRRGKGKILKDDGSFFCALSALRGI